MTHEATPLTADEFLKFNAIAERATKTDLRCKLSIALSYVNQPQSYFVVDAWGRAVSQMWLTALDDVPAMPQT